MTKSSVAVIGPGRMGIGIATAVLMTGPKYAVTVVDTKKREKGRETEALDRARGEIEANLALLSNLGLLGKNAGHLDENLWLTRDLAKGTAGCSFIFEALPETVEAKRPFFEAIGGIMAPEAIIASATSTFHLDVFWDMCSRPENVVSAHWLNPAFLIPLVEVGHGEKTHSDAPDRLCAFLEEIGKIPVKMKSSPGFIVPRIQAAAMNEAVRILQEGVTGAEEIDTAIKAGFGFRLGVLGLLEFVDLGGVDILFHAGNYLHGKLGGEHFEPPDLVREKMEKGELGPKSGKGFFDYQGLDVRALFEDRYQGFVELLRLYHDSDHLDFFGGLGKDHSIRADVKKRNGQGDANDR